MGLDISAYQNAIPVRVEATDEDGDPVDLKIRKAYWDGDIVKLWISPHFVERADGLDAGFYIFEEDIRFRAGSYGGYNRWRSRLAEVGGYSAEKAHTGVVTSGPFYELVNFSDCDGTIGPKTSEKLLNDFVSLRKHAAEVMDTYELSLYDQWTEAFKMASESGFVSFH